MVGEEAGQAANAVTRCNFLGTGIFNICLLKDVARLAKTIWKDGIGMGEREREGTQQTRQGRTTCFLDRD